MCDPVIFQLVRCFDLLPYIHVKVCFMFIVV